LNRLVVNYSSIIDIDQGLFRQALTLFFLIYPCR